MADGLGILVKLKAGDHSELVKDIKALEGQIPPIKVDLDLGNAKELVSLLKQVNTVAGKTGKLDLNIAGNAKQTVADLTRVQNALNRATRLMQQANSQKYSGFSIDTRELERMATTVERMGKLTSNDALRELNLEIAKVQGNIQKANAAINGQNFSQKISKDAINSTTQLRNMQAEIQRIKDTYRSLSDSSSIKLDNLFGEMENAIGSATQVDVDKFRSQLSAIKTELEVTGQRTDSLSGKLRRLFTEHFNTAVAMAGVHALQQSMQLLWQSVQDVDAAMTELKKVTSESDATYEKFLSNAGERAKALGTAMSDVINSTADFARLGYTLDEATQLADAASIYKNVGDGLSDINEASQSIISTMKAFGIEAEDSMQIVDKFNEVGNNFAISSSGIGEALQRSAAALAQAGNDINESIGLIVAGNAVVQDPDSVGTALKTMSLRLTKTKTELEEIGEASDYAATSVSEFRNQIKAYTGVDIMDGDAYRSTYDILVDIAKVWDQINNQDQQALLYMLGGARQANVVASIIKNIEDAEEAVKTAANSSGSAVEENEKYLDSIAGKLSQFTAQFQSLSTTLIDSEVPKFFIDAGTGALQFFEAINKTVGVLPTLIGLLSGGLTLAGQKAGKVNMPFYASCGLMAA